MFLKGRLERICTFLLPLCITSLNHLRRLEEIRYITGKGPCDPQSLKRLFIKNHHYWIAHITQRAKEYCGKPLRYIHKSYLFKSCSEAVQCLCTEMGHHMEIYIVVFFYSPLVLRKKKKKKRKLCDLDKWQKGHSDLEAKSSKTVCDGMAKVIYVQSNKYCFQGHVFISHINFHVFHIFNKIVKNYNHLLISSIPEFLLTVVGKNGNITQRQELWNSLECVAGLKRSGPCTRPQEINPASQNEFSWVQTVWNEIKAKENGRIAFQNFPYHASLFWFRLVINRPYRAQQLLSAFPFAGVATVIHCVPHIDFA